ncbi:hypothetical protein [Coprococcus comes]|uniref:hypothetical protein n=1 Tax=Coprococcus comes TaxID=410072 RepID=UPI00232D3FE8|nr:hypothetical protein [Coprococcus comes]MDC0797602.1 hypothetical protein [Coprococcus comes]
MPYIAPEVVTEAKRMDLLTYLRTYEPGQLVRVSGNTYCTREHDSLKISNGKWMWWSRGIGGRTALDYLIKVRSFDYALTQMGYEHSLSESRKYWTIVPKGYTKPIRLKNLGEDYTEEAIKRRLMENQRVRIVPFAKQTVVIRQYRLPTREQKIKKVGGLYGLYLHYCYKLGYLPKYKKQNTKRLHYLLKEDLLKLDKITAETRLLGREHIFTDEQLFSYKASLNGQIETLIDDRTHLRKISRTKMSDDELSKVKGQIVSISGKIRELRKEVWLCDDIAERSKVMEQNLETIRAEEEKQERKEQNRYDKRR